MVFALALAWGTGCHRNATLSRPDTKQSVPKSEGTAIAAISAGGLHTCALTTAGGVKCWGWNNEGQLGEGTEDKQHEPTDVKGLATGVAAIALGSWHTCALTTKGGVKCWGYNEYGLLGDSTTDKRHEPTDVKGLASGVAAISADSFHTCALTNAGGVKCWGRNEYGKLGDGTEDDRHEPTDVKGLASGVAAIATGQDHTCALTTAGGVKCWGGNAYGELGDGTTDERSEPTNVRGLASGVAAIATGVAHTCALTTKGGVKCWGSNRNGKLGDGTAEDERHEPTDVKGLASSVAAIVTGDYHICALTTEGGIKCWGNNRYGQLGDGTTDERHEPIDVKGLVRDVAEISAGSLHTCALTTAGGVKCWGNNHYGQLGDGTTDNRLEPTDVKGLASGVGVSAPSKADGSF